MKSKMRKVKDNVVAIRGSFENIPAFLHHVAADPDIEAVMIFTVDKHGNMKDGHVGFTRAEMALAAAMAASYAVEPD